MKIRDIEVKELYQLSKDYGIVPTIVLVITFYIIEWSRFFSEIFDLFADIIYDWSRSYGSRINKK